MRKYLLTFIISLFVGCMSNKHIIDPDGNILNKSNLFWYKLSSDGSIQPLDTLKLKLYRISNDTLYPNSLFSTATFLFSVPSYSHVSFQFTSLDSNIYSDIFKDSLSSGSYKLNIFINAPSEILPSGVYLFKQTIDNVITKRKFLIIR